MKNPLGLYLHIPFCRSRCRYCDFYSTMDHHRIPDFLAALKKEIALCEKPEGFAVESLYFGGGTPSFLSARNFEDVFVALDKAFGIPQDAEITLEANPGTLDQQKLKNLRRLGVNRLSLGLQSLSDEKLRFLGRSHDAAQGRLAFKMAREAGFDNISLDFIYGLPEETPSSWQGELEKAAALKPEHLSLYMLTIEGETPMGKDLAMGRISPPDEKIVADLFRLTLSHAESLGYPWYEVSNFAVREDFRSRHNLGYWNGRPWLAFGPGGHGFFNSRRFANIADLDRYMEILLCAERLPREPEEEITREMTRIEALYLGFRMREGIALQGFDKLLNTSFVKDYTDLIRHYREKGFLVCEKDFCRLTEEGLLFLDAITADFVAAL